MESSRADSVDMTNSLHETLECHPTLLSCATSVGAKVNGETCQLILISLLPSTSMSLLDVLPWIAQAQHALLKPSPVFGLPWMDVLGTPRLSIALDQVFRQVNLSNRPSFFSEASLSLSTVHLNRMLTSELSCV